MITLEDARELWIRWSIVLVSAIIFYSLLYAFTMRYQMARKARKIVHDSGLSHSHSSQNELVSHEPEPEQHPPADQHIYTAENCSKYASCVLSTCNCVVCIVAAILSLIIEQNWKDPLYGTPGICFYALALLLSYLLSELVAIFVVHFHYKTPKIPWDIITHHVLFVVPPLWMEVPIPKYGWIYFAFMYLMEITTLFLNANFMAKWYKVPESAIFKIKLAFVVSWLLVRVPISFGFAPAYCIMNGKEMYEQIPFDKFMAPLVMTAVNAIMQGMWTVLIIKKTYQSVMGKNDEVDAVDNFDLTVPNDGDDIDIANAEDPPLDDV